MPTSGTERANGQVRDQVEDQERGQSWLARHRALTEVLYQVRRDCPGWIAASTSTLSPRHPVPPDQLALLADGESLGGSLAESERRGAMVPGVMAIGWRWLRALLFAARDAARLAVLQIRFGRAVRERTTAPATMVLKTWAFGATTPAGTGDFYYGTLPAQLEARGVACALLCGDAVGLPNAAFVAATLRRSDARAIPELLLISPLRPLGWAIRQIAAAWRLRALAMGAESPSVKRVCAAACVASLEPIAMRNALQFDVARAAVRRLRGRVFVAFYEGQPWEQASRAGAKAGDPRCLTVGYQHTIMMRYQWSLLEPERVPGPAAAPDVALCVGAVTRDMLARSAPSRSNRLVAFGSFRRSADQPSGRPRPAGRVVLVLPEGNLPESRLLFEFAMRLAPLAPDCRFVFRCHPLLPFDRVRPHLSQQPEPLPNVELSPFPSIAEDFERASLVLYRGSSSVLYAVLRGLKPVYVYAEGAPEIDPLFEVAGWRERAASTEEAAAILRRFAAADDGAAAADWQPVADYVNAYTMPVTAASIDQLLVATGLAESTPKSNGPSTADEPAGHAGARA